MTGYDFYFVVVPLVLLLLCCFLKVIVLVFIKTAVDSFFLSYSAVFCLLIVGVGGYCCIRSHAVTHTVGLLWTSDRPVAETST